MGASLCCYRITSFSRRLHQSDFDYHKKYAYNPNRIPSSKVSYQNVEWWFGAMNTLWLSTKHTWV